MKSNITLIALNATFKKEIAKQLAERLGMFYVDVNDLIKYDLLNIKQVISVAGLDYYNKVETKTVGSVSSYENTLITLDNDTFFNNDNYKLLKDSSIFIYLKLNFNDYKTIQDNEKDNSEYYEKLLNEKLFIERDLILSSVSDIVVPISLSTKNKVNTITNKIKKYFKEVL